MAVHSLDVLIFVVAVVSICGYGAKIAFTAWRSQQTQHSASTEPELNVDCWVPAHFTSSHERYSTAHCKSKFINLLEGRDSHGIYKPVLDVVPSANSSLEDLDTDFSSAWDIYRSDQVSEDSADGPQADHSLYSRLIVLLSLMLTLALVTFALAISFGNMAKAYTGYVEIAWLGAVKEGGDAHDDEATGTQGTFINNSGIASDCVRMLWSRKTLAVCYLVFQIAVLLLWFCLGMACYHASTEVMGGTANIHQGEVGSSTLNFDEGADGGTAPSEGHGNNTTPTRDSGAFMCDYTVIRLGNLQRYTIQCNYDVSRNAHPSVTPQGRLALMSTWSHLAREGMTYALVIDVLILVHILSFFVAGPLARKNSLSPVLQSMGVKQGNIGLKLGLTDLNFVASFAKLGGSTIGVSKQPSSAPHLKGKSDLLVDAI